MARENPGPVLTQIEREAQEKVNAIERETQEKVNAIERETQEQVNAAQEQVNAAQEQVNAAQEQVNAIRQTLVNATVNAYKVKYQQESGTLLPKEERRIRSLLPRLEPQTLVNLLSQLAAASTLDQAKSAMGSCLQEIDDHSTNGANNPPETR